MESLWRLIWWGELMLSLGIGWFIWEKFGFWWGLLAVFVWPAWLGYRLAVWVWS